MYTGNLSRYRPGASEAELLGAYEKAISVARPKKYKFASKKVVQLGGQAGLEIHLEETPCLWEVKPKDVPFIKKHNDDGLKRMGTEGRKIVVFVVPRGECMYMISLEQAKTEPEADILKTVTESLTLTDPVGGPG